MTRRARFWVLVSAKGGIGKSVTALHMGHAAAQRGQRVLLIDTATGLANLHLLAGVQPQERLERVMAQACTVEAAITPLAPGLDLIAADNGPRLSFTSSGVDAELEAALRTAAHQYDLIILDTPSGLSETLMPFCTTCERTILLTTAEPTCLANTYTWYKLLTLGYGCVPVWLVGNQTASDRFVPGFLRLCARHLESTPRWVGGVPDDPDIRRAVELQRPVFEVRPQSPAWHATVEIVRQLQHAERQTLDGSDIIADTRG